MPSERSKHAPISSTQPPRTLNVQKFAESRARELESLHSIVSNRLNHDFRIRRSKRRRTTGHDDRVTKNRRRKRQKLANGHEPGGSNLENDQKKVSRRTRRRIEFQKNPQSGFCTSADGTKRLRTHLWHTKRFTMVKRWGFYIPLGLQGRGRGSRAVLKWLKNGALIHDVSYYQPIQLEGTEDSILAVLRMVLVPSPSDVSEESSQPIYYGVCYENALLYHVGAPVSQLIAPVTYMWRPCFRGSCHIKVEDPIPNESSVSFANECSTSSRQLWIWIHAAAFREGFDALRSACQKQIHESGASVSCFSLEGQLAKLDVMGSKATQILQKILCPVSKYSFLVACTNSQLQKSFVLDHAEHLPSHAILSLTVHDPRDLPSKGDELVPKAPCTRLEGDLQEEDFREPNALASGVSNKNEDILLSLWSKPQANGSFLSDSKDLWDSCDKLNPPIQEHILCKEKRQKRLKFFYLDSTNYGTPTTETEECLGRSCSILLLKHTSHSRFYTGWSIILPLCWVKAFWISLVSQGAHAIGLRERRWIACDNAVPSFPFDYPDCKAYSSFMTAEAAEAAKAAELRPLAVRPLRVPIPPPWDCVTCTVEEGHIIMGDFQTLDLQRLGDLAPVSKPSLENFGSCFPGFIPRTSNVLSEYLKKTHDSYMFLFPKMGVGEMGFSDLIDKDRVTTNVNPMPADRKFCFIRVLLHAYKEGVFEEGAIVCAPILADLSLWTSRSEEHENLQIPQSSVKSYFTQRDGKWELQIPEDCPARQSHRWPIGFVTTGFVRGSTKPVAEAFCEATMLSRLRGQQWNQMQKQVPDIYVLVRNLRSAAYRRALATIVLEQHKEDAEFM